MMRGRVDSEWIDVAGAAELLDVTPKAIRARVARRCIPFRKFGGRIMFNRAELRDFFEKLPGVSIGEALVHDAQRRREVAS
jgi:hypothetical protein